MKTTATSAFSAAITAAKGFCALLPGYALLVEPSRICNTPPPLMPRFTSFTARPFAPSPDFNVLSSSPTNPFCHVVESPKKTTVIPSLSGLPAADKAVSPGTS